MSEWISVEDRLPEKLIPVLVYHVEGCFLHEAQCVAMLWDENQEWRKLIGGSRFERNPTHWMSLPEPPE